MEPDPVRTGVGKENFQATAFRPNRSPLRKSIRSLIKGLDSVTRMTTKQLAKDTVILLERIAKQSPRVHCLTNSVAQPITANSLLAIGAIPSLTADLEDMPALLVSADALLINLGTPDADTALIHDRAVTIAGDVSLPWVLDPVMVDRAPARRSRAEALIGRSPTALRGNGDEVAALSGALQAYPGILAITGSKDRICQGERLLELKTGHSMMTRVTATGCALSALVAAFLAVGRSEPLLAVTAALAAFGAAGIHAAQQAYGPGSFSTALLDHLATLNEQRIESGLLQLEDRS